VDDLGRGQRPEVMTHYPHMLPDDTVIWTRYLTQPVQPLERVWYDVHVGSSNIPDDTSDQMLRKIAQGVTRKRIDVVAQVKSSLWVIEVKPFADARAMGQVQAYLRLFQRDYRLALACVPVIVCEDFDPDLVPDFEELGITVFAV